ncbi:NADH-quinone oxidoreductase subunit N [Dysgonomonas sp. 25]|uniref:NADH-quinone oxidoreductase subunit N n=1 Tax=Dysgonomonas sp. 25 TaxID=2302933 RepID=UPI0013D5F109|nr:NADH-quinone oxidoreductase subunit N [Dysgonomonas sp. 25]NDV69875.1 NADH-quinone oxidoreductase subunit N [Dysgonomonas sp. 25]
MNTLIAISGLGIICLVLEVLNLRKVLVPIIIAALLAILGLTAIEYYFAQSFLDLDSGMVETTTYSLGFSMLFIILAIFLIAMSPRFYQEQKTKIADYVSLKLFLLAGAVAMVSFGNMAMFFLGLEVLSIAVYVLAASNVKDLRSNEAGLKYFIMGAFASSFVLFGIAMIYGATGTFDINSLYILSSTVSMPVWFNIGFVMICIGMLFKASIFPFHFWAPDVYEGSPTLTTAMMSTLVKVAAIGALFKLVSTMSGMITPAYQTVIVVLSILTMTVANITGLRQTNIKRMMAFSGISHAGFMIMTLLAVTSSANAVLYYAAAYSLAGIAAFAIILSVCEGKGNEDISNFYGLARRQPLLATILTFAMLSMAGIPIFAGFFAKLFVFEQMLEINQLVLVIFGVVNSIIAVYYYLGVVNVMIVKTNDEKKVKSPYAYRIVAVLAILMNIALGLFPDIIMGTPL